MFKKSQRGHVRGTFLTAQPETFLTTMGERSLNLRQDYEVFIGNY